MNNQQFNKDEDAQVGIGTMIVFIATILVAAVAAGVLIDTSQKLQTKATDTGQQATDSVGTALEVLSVHGTRTTDTDNLEVLRVQVRLAAGAETISLAALKVNFLDNAGLTTYSAGDETVASQFGAYDLVGAAKTTLGAGETALLLFGGGAIDLDLANDEDISMEFLPQVGHSVAIDFSTPATYGTDLVFELF